MIKKILSVFILCSIFLLSGCGKKDNRTALQKIQERDKLIVGVNFEAKPFGYVENSNLKGFDVELARIIAKNLLGSAEKVEFKPITPSNRILSLNSEQIDLIISAMTINDQRKNVVSFSPPYFTAGQVLLVPKSSKIKTLGELNNKRTIVILGSTGEKNLRYYAPNAMVQGHRSYKDAFDSLKSNRADAMVGDDSILIPFTKSNPRFKVLPKRYTQEHYGVAYRKTEDSKTLGNEVDDIIINLQERGTLAQMKKKFF